MTAVSGVARNYFRGEQIQGVSETEVPQWGPGAKPLWGSEGEAPEADDLTIKYVQLHSTHAAPTGVTETLSETTYRGLY